VLLDAKDPRREETLRRYAWQTHSNAARLYERAVRNYLSQKETFTYADFAHIKRAGIVSGQWEERVWVSLIALRSENLSAPLEEVPTIAPFDHTPYLGPSKDQPAPTSKRETTDETDELPERDGTEGS
jgi:hypothetical protein